MTRIIIVGTSGAGKSVLGEQAAQKLGVPFLELDAYFWQPNWVQASPDVFRQRVTEAVIAEAWTAGGNYSVARDLIWKRADTLVWLDYPLLLTLWRLFRRTVKRIVTQEDLWHTGNRESWRTQFLSRNSLFLWAIGSHGRYRRQYAELLKSPEYSHLDVHRFSKPSEASLWLNHLSKKE
ncbi:MAG: adenylate kinase [Anaerolineaceae bacterium]|nr:adenylate kinase [Anaerolineaceae bacterium]